MNIEELKVHPAFVTLGTDQQRAWVLAYCSNGADKIKATDETYSCSNEASTRARADSNLRHPAIKRLVNDFYGMTDETGSPEEFLSIVWKRVRDTSDPEVQYDWAVLYAKIKGYDAKKSEPADSPVDSVDDLVRQLEEKGKG